ncbi:hypothetical protein [Moraxella equi]|uniref:Uncharacterized protein n=1 Tax=Moraxella equi TaxID=60442 RepID=A0A378QMF5_9GAMM|nr:hypothetical protein [Moraxella equi]OPH39246.1 hypothetical protein B5J93_04300 [Moraxella equi]STZ01891.1 Uncharacterised protein [Moraxella equi]
MAEFETIEESLKCYFGVWALGSDITAMVDNSVFLSDKSSSNGVHTTADGGNYTYAGANDVNVAGVTNSTTAPNTTPVVVVSVGTKGGQTRQIQNVAAGVVSADSTDAINGSRCIIPMKPSLIWRVIPSMWATS